MREQYNNNSALDFIFKVPKKLLFHKLYRYYFDFILRLLYRVFIFDNLPETVSETFLKLILFTQGKICFFAGELIGESEPQLLALNCSRADTPDVYYIPRKVLITNPRLVKSYNITPGKDCEIVYLSEADKYNLTDINGGLFNLIERTATMLADNDISINIAQKNTRLVNLVSADTQNTVDSIKAVFAKMYEGDPDIVVKSSLVDKLAGVPILQNQSNHNLVELIEVQQYILSHFYEQIGICTHDQMKRERLITAEINDNLDLAYLNIDDMLISIQEGLQRVNEMFGMSISARLNPIIIQQREEEQAGASAAEDSNLTGTAPDEDPEEATELEATEEPTLEPEAEPEESQSPENDTTEEVEEASEPGQEPGQEQAPEEEAQPEEDEATQEITINIEGDNNSIIIGGDDVGSTDEDSPQNLGSDNADRDESQ